MHQCLGIDQGIVTSLLQKVIIVIVSSLATRKWLGVPPDLTDIAFYCCQATSEVQEYEVGKARLLTMLEDLKDKVIRPIQPKLKTGRKWKVQGTAKESLMIKEIIGHTQANRQNTEDSTAEPTRPMDDVGRCTPEVSQVG
ncbi:Hypothetical predicted protein [Octopus vulgaris]|uniref:Uncharacterized protein n=1 Tax=Octopus vulgaris TaxID=6645 RepID=A0AA36FG47_OCTVU|nr:Hypothetical predicted protein [Octopus vulgaris]